MIDVDHAINYLKQVVEQLKDSNMGNLAQLEVVEGKKKQIVLDRAKLTEREAAFLTKSQGHGKEVERITKMEALAKKMKLQVDEDRAQVMTDRIVVARREKNVTDLEKKQVELEKREELVEARESDISEREEIVERDKATARSKQADLDLREKGIKKQQTRLQGMIDAQKITWYNTIHDSHQPRRLKR